MIEYFLYLFFEALILNFIPMFGAPFVLLAVPVLVILGINIYNMLIISIILGLGAALGKTLMYYLGYIFSFSRRIRENKNLLLVKRFSKTRNFKLAFFLTTLLPIFPFDDFLALILGMQREKFMIYFILLIIGKFLKSFVELILLVYVLQQISVIVEIPLFELSIYSAIIFLLMSLALFKLDWEKYINKWKLKRKYV
ncbi:MAG: VTT domain-containing protein [Nanopusillaceae archaeon]